MGCSLGLVAAKGRVFGADGSNQLMACVWRELSVRTISFGLPVTKSQGVGGPPSGLPGLGSQGCHRAHPSFHCCLCFPWDSLLPRCLPHCHGALSLSPAERASFSQSSSNLPKLSLISLLGPHALPDPIVDAGEGRTPIGQQGPMLNLDQSLCGEIGCSCWLASLDPCLSLEPTT